MKTNIIIIIILSILIVGSCIILFTKCKSAPVNTPAPVNASAPNASSEYFIAPTQVPIDMNTIDNVPREHFVDSPYLETTSNLVGHPSDSYYSQNPSTKYQNSFLDSYFENVGIGSNQSFNSPSDSLMMAQNAARGHGDINGLVGEMDIMFHNQAEVKGMNV